jgi:uncharacterized protein (DUF3820 family)
MKMPFGKHKGVDLDQVPATYLDWLHGQDWIKKFPDVLKYIEDNRGLITQQLKIDGVLDNE